MTERERLIELIIQSVNGCARNWAETIADYLLTNGVVVLPCKVGDTVWIVYGGYITTAKVLAFYFDGVGGMVDLSVYIKEETVAGNKSVINKDYTDKDIFLTKEEAEKALERSKSNELAI